MKVTNSYHNMLTIIINLIVGSIVIITGMVQDNLEAVVLGSACLIVANIYISQNETVKRIKGKQDAELFKEEVGRSDY